MVSTRQPWFRYLAVALPATAIALALPAGLGREVAHLVVGLSGAAAILTGVRLYRPVAPGTWYAAAAAQVAWLTGDALHCWGEAAHGEEFAHVAGGLAYLVGYFLIMLAAVRAARGRSGVYNTTDLLDVALFTAPTLLVTWVLIVEPAVVAWQRAGAVSFPVELAFPLATIGMLGGFLRLARAPGAGRRAAAAPAVAVAMMIAMDALGATSEPLIAAHPIPFDSRWLVTYPLAGAAVLHPAITKVTAPGAPRGQPAHAAQVLVLVLAMLTGPAMLTWQAVHGGPVSGPAVAGFTVVTTLLVGARMLQLVRMINLQATTDDLTGLPNRRALHATARGRLADLGTPQALLLLDLDRFKEVNDSLGHHAGDALLIQVAERLRARLRPGDILARLGGDEFAVLLDGVDRAGAELVAAELRAGLEAPFALDELSVHTTASIGVALFPEHGTDLSTLLRRVDAAMYRAKRRGPVEVHVAGDDDHAEQLRLAEDLRTGLARGELVLHHQPKVDLRTDRVTGVEALVRWQHPTRGLLMPAVFLDRAEAAGLMPALTAEVLRLALNQAETWWDRGDRLQVAVNLSASSLLDVELPHLVMGELAARDLPAAALRLEITEEVLMSDRARARTVLAALRRAGVGISVDDFGTGYSSLAYLRDLPIDELKLDRAFVAPMAEDPRSAALVASVIALAHSLGLDMVAEGVEDATTRALLARLGCDQAQGFWVSRPLPADALRAWLAARDALVPDGARH